MRIFKKNNRWYIDFRLNKKRIRKDFDTKEQAEFFYLLEKKKIYKITEAEPIIESKSENTFKEFFQTYKNYKFPSISPATQKKINAIFEIFMDYIFSKYSDKIEINAITPKMIIDFISGQSKQFAPKTVNNRIVYIRELFKFAVDMQIIKESPVIVKFVKEKKTIPEYYSSENIKNMLTAARNKDNYFIIINLLLYTGIRKQEMENLKWENIDFENNFIKIFSTQGFTTKTERSNRKIPLNKNLKEILLDWYKKEFKKSEYVIHTAEGNKGLFMLFKNPDSLRSQDFYFQR